MMNPSDILFRPREWKPISREEALRQYRVRAVVVISRKMGMTHAFPFDPFNPYFRPSTQDLRGLQYFIRIGWPAGTAAGGGGTGTSKAAPKGSEPTAEPMPEAAAEPGKTPPQLRLASLDCEWFAPLADTLLIRYEITGDVDQAESVHLRIASGKTPDKYILEKKLDGAPQAKGMFMWDGAVTDPEYDGCLNLIGSPYWVQLGLALKGAAPRYGNKAQIRVELMQTELIVGEAPGPGVDGRNGEAVSVLREELKRTPGRGRIHMPGSFFKVEDGDMDDHHSYSEYMMALQNGIPIPLFVKLWLKGKGGGKKRSAQAITGTRILWDTLPEDESSFDGNLADRGVHEPARKFMKNIILYKKDGTEPPGATAQWELGGMRSVAAGRRYRLHFKSLFGEWEVEPPLQRSWAGFSQCAKAAGSDADSGMLYFNGRIAGDRYQVTAYVDSESSLDRENPQVEDVPAERKSQSLILQNWRDVNLSRSYKIGADTASLSFEEANEEFRKAALSIVSRPGLVPMDIQAEWKIAYRNCLTAPDIWPFTKDAAETDPGSYPASFVPYEEYWERSNPDAGFVGKVWHRIKAFFGAANDTVYIKKCDDAAYFIYTTAAKAFPVGERGLTCFKFNQVGEHNRQRGPYTAGIAPKIKGFSARNRAVLFIFSGGHATDTVVHEVGHHLFLPHAPGHFNAGENPAGHKPALHDKDQLCIMSYHPHAKYFCALCLLRMGGWNHTYIRNDGSVSDPFQPS